MRLATAVLLASATCTAGAQAPSAPTTLTALRDVARPLLIFASDPHDPQLAIQLRMIRQNAAASEERQIVPVAILFRTPSYTNVTLTESEEVAARLRFHINGEFTVILLGKDGTEKLRATKPIPFRTLQSTIDAMPMRQDESKNPAH